MAVPLAVAAVCGVATAAPALAATTAPLAVATTYLPPDTAQTSYSVLLNATGGTKPYTWSVSAGALPAGLTLHPATGAITGKPTVTGPDSFTVEVTDSESTPATATAPESITVTASPLSVTTTSLPGGTAGVAYSAKLAATGGVTPYTWLLSGGSLPEGLTLRSDGTIAGTPKTAGTADFAVEVADSDSPAESATASLSIAVGVAPLSITTSNLLPGAWPGRAYSVKLAADGGIAPYTWSLISGPLPPGLTLRKNGTISGTPSGSGNYNFTVQVTDSETPAHTIDEGFSLLVHPPLSINLGELQSPPTAYAGVPYDLPLAATDDAAPYTWSIVSGSLPQGLTLDPVGGAITGTPAVSTDYPAGPYTFTVQVTDSENPPATATLPLTITVAPPLTIAAAPLPAATVKDGYSAALNAANGAQPYSWSLGVKQALPAGLTLDPGSGVISGTPTGQPGTYTFTVQVTDSEDPPATATAALSLVVLPAPLTVNVAGCQSQCTADPGYIGNSYDQDVDVSGGIGPFTWSLTSGSLPPGLSLHTSGVSALTIAGTPTGTPGPYTFTVQATDSEDPPATASITLTIDVVAPPTITTTSLDQAVDGDPYSAALSAEGGVAPYTWSVLGKAALIVPGLTIDPSTGVISGTPAAEALGVTYSFTVEVSDANGYTADATLQIQVISPNG